jgi:TetR/AcrR family transcriptional repressor of nem operon
MTKSEQTREFIIEKSAPIFNRKGYAGTSMADLLEATGLTKGAIYGNFENKDEVALEVFRYNIAGIKKRLKDSITHKDTASGKLRAFAGYYRTNWKSIAERGGCPFLNASVEADDNLPFLRTEVQKSIKNWAQMLSDIIEEGIQNKEFTHKINAMDYAYEIIALVEGGMMLSKIYDNPKYLFSAFSRIQVIMDQEMKR